MLSLFWKLFLTMWLSIVGFSAAIGMLNDKLAREQWAEEPANTFQSMTEFALHNVPSDVVNKLGDLYAFAGFQDI